MNPIRLIAVNGLIRVASAATGQIIAFIVAERSSGQIGAPAGALLVGGLAASFYVTELVGAPVAGSIADKRGQARVLRWGPLFGVVSVCAAAAAAQGNLSVLALAIVLLGVRITEGLSAATAVPTTLALLGASSESNPVLRLRLMGSFEIVSLIGLIVGYVAGGVAWDEFRGAGLLLFAAVYAVALLLARADSTRAERPPVGTPPARNTLRALVRLPGVGAFVTAWLAVNAVVGVWVQQAPFLMKLPERSATQTLVGGYSGTAIGLIFGTWAAVFLVGIGLWSFAAPSWPRRRTLMMSLAGMLTVVVSLALVNHGAPRGFFVLAIAGVLVESGFTPAAFAHMADLTDHHRHARGMAMGVYSMLLGAGQFAGAVIAAPAAASAQMDGVLLVTALLALVALEGVRRMRTDAGLSAHES